jgi:undecaprenyl-diphosphatase
LVNGLLLLGAEQLRGHAGSADSEYEDERVTGPVSDQRIAKIPVAQAVLIGSAQILALAPGISRSGVTMVGGLLRGLSREDAARFSFLLATPVALAAGALKLGDLSGPLGAGIRGQVLFGSLLSGIEAYLSVRFLTRHLANRSLRPLFLAWWRTKKPCRSTQSIRPDARRFIGLPSLRRSQWGLRSVT